MTAAQQIRKLKREIAAVEIELDRLKALPKIDVHKALMKAAAAAWRGELPPPAGRVKPVCHSRLS